MKIRDVVLQDRLVQAVNARTWTFNINLVDPVTEFKVWFFTKNHATGPNVAGCIPYLVEEIAVIDGSEVIAAMNGPECIAMYCFDHARTPFHWHQELGGMSQYWCLPITFGRDLWDEEWIFDPRKFRNPQLRITFDIQAVAAVGAGAYATATDDWPAISVWAKIMEEGARPKGYLMNKQLKEFASLSGGQEITYLPTDFNIRKLMVRAYKKCGQMNDAITRLKLSQDEDKWIPWDLNSHDFIWLMRDWFPEVTFHLKHEGTDNDQREHYGGTYAQGLLVSATQGRMVSVRGWAGNCFTMDIEDVTNSTVTNTQAWSKCQTRTPFDCYCYPFGDQNDDRDWLDVSQMGNLRLILTQGAEDYLEQIVVQQAHPY